MSHWYNRPISSPVEALASKRARLVYELCIGTGQRIGDVVKMQWAHFSDDGFDFTQGKTDKPLWIPLTDRLREHLAGYERGEGTVVTNAKGQSVSYRIVAEEMRAIKKKMEHEKAGYYKTHGLRKNATIELYLAGCDDEMVKAVTGHSGVEMLKKYGGPIRQRELAKRAQEARNQMERSKTET
ncbi:site-specific integrase [Halocynthiibacter namhaensis]|uniref:site-specific integrase n=1 Tax=Halocynthiibacter namhaensis TaxID=1290553 RepID=UPI001EE1F883|nr:tyrosine-type recombinase/integrase [Halocynthiibacter namhaensis]